MQENVGPVDRTVRSVVGPALMLLGATRLGARDGALLGLAALVGGALLVENAITGVCPLNAALGIRTP
jgi:uncharacterized membrane protein